jgi:N-acetylneuraminic acid mutarotase
MATTPWASVRPLPKALINPSAAFRNGRLYVTGATNDARKLYVYDEASDTWETRAPLPNPGVIYPFVATRPNQLWLAGGVDPSTNLVTKNLWRYRYEVDDWTKMEPLPAPRHTNGAATDSRTIGRMYVIGGLSKRTRVDANSVRSEMYVYDYETNKWSNRPAMANSRYGHAVGHRAGKLYVIGGRNGANDFATVMRCYDTLRNKWTDLAPPPVNVRQTIAVEGYTKIVLTCVGATRQDTYVYDVASNTWGIADTSGHDGRTKPGAARSADYVYMVGGVDSSGLALKSVMRLPIPDAIDDDFFGQFWPRNKDVAEFGHWEDVPVPVGPSAPADTAWKTKAALPAYRQQHTSALINGKVYVFGGSDATGATYSKTTYCYDPATNAWTTKADMPQTTYSVVGAGVINGMMYLAGGYRNGGYPAGVSSALTRYNPQTDQWTTLAPMPAAVAEGSDVSSVVNGLLYAVGGYNSGSKNTLYCYDPATNAWTTKAAMPVAIDNPASASLGGKLYVTAGTASTGNVKTLYQYDPAANSWSAKADMPVALTTTQLVAIKNKLYALGGGGSNGSQPTDVYEYDSVANSWSSRPDMVLTSGRVNGTASSLDDTTIILIGGSAGTTVQSFNLGGTSTTAPAVNEDPIPYDSPLVYWKMDDAVGSTSATDYSGNDYNTSLRTDFASTPPTFGAIGVGGTPAVNMTPSGIGLYSQVPVSLWNEFTMEGWFVAKTGGTCTIAGLGVSTTYTTGDGASLSWDGTSTLQFVMNNALVSSTSLAADNAWHHVAVVRSKTAGTVKLYIDGVMKLSTSYSNTMNGSGADLVEAAVHYRHGGANASNVYLTERLAFFDKALTDAQIAKHASLLVDPATLPHESPDQVWIPEVLEGQFWPRQSPEVEIGHLEYEAPFDPPPTTFKYDTNWSSLPNMPFTWDQGMSALIGDTIYITGGYKNNTTAWNIETWAYKITDGSWTQKSSLPAGAPIYGSFNGIVGGKWYLAGGRNALVSGTTSYIKEVWCYNPTNDTWTQVNTSMPENRSAQFATTSCAINGKLYIAGGYWPDGPTDQDTYSKKTMCYDPATNSWSFKADVPNRIRMCNLVSYKGKLYVLSGQGWDVSPHPYAYDPATDTWETLPDLNPYGPYALDSSNAAASGNRLFLHSSGGQLADLTTIKIFNLTTKTWEPTINVGGDNRRGAFYAYGGKLYWVGGNTFMNDSTPLNQIRTLSVPAFGSESVYIPGLDFSKVINPYIVPAGYSQTGMVSGAGTLSVVTSGLLTVGLSTELVRDFANSGGDAEYWATLDAASAQWDPCFIVNQADAGTWLRVSPGESSTNWMEYANGSNIGYGGLSDATPAIAPAKGDVFHAKLTAGTWRFEVISNTGTVRWSATRRPSAAIAGNSKHGIGNSSGSNSTTWSKFLTSIDSANAPDPIVPNAKWVSDGVAGLIWP